jgi:hypothetical protein
MRWFEIIQFVSNLVKRWTCIFTHDSCIKRIFYYGIHFLFMTNLKKKTQCPMYPLHRLGYCDFCCQCLLLKISWTSKVCNVKSCHSKCKKVIQVLQANSFIIQFSVCLWNLWSLRLNLNSRLENLKILSQHSFCS